MKKIAYILLSLASLISCKNLDKHNKHIESKISPTKLKKDIDYIEKNLFKLHPDTDWYISKNDLHKKFDSLRKSIVEPMTPNEFFMKISPIVSQVRQGHMSLSPLSYSYKNSERKKHKNSTHPLQGYEYLYKNNKLIIKNNKRKNKKDQAIPVGTEIVDINGISPQFLFEKYKKTYSSDGFNTTFINPLFERKINLYYTTELKYVDSVKMQLKCADSTFFHTSYREFKTKKNKPNKKQKDSISQAKKDSISTIEKKKDTINKVQLTKKERKDKRKQTALENRLKRWKGYNYKEKTYAKELSYPIKQDSTTALLKLTNFVDGNPKIYDTIFKEIAQHKVENLIIDLRGNTGGKLNDIYQLSKYLNKEDYYFIDPYIVANKAFTFHIIKGEHIIKKALLSPVLGIFATIRTLKTKKENGLWKYHPRFSKLTKPYKHAYTNKLYVLTDGSTFSAGAIIASHLRSNKKSIFVGEETGGTFNGTVAGQMPVVKLPHSKLKWRFGLISVKPSHKTPVEGNGIMPDVEIIPSIEDIIEKNDPALDWIINTIKSEK